MVNTLLIIWSVLASVTVFVVGLVLVVSPYGATWPGVIVTVLAAGLGIACVQLCREQWRRRRSKHVHRNIPAGQFIAHKRRHAKPVLTALHPRRVKAAGHNRSSHQGESAEGQFPRAAVALVKRQPESKAQKVSVRRQT